MFRIIWSKMRNRLGREKAEMLDFKSCRKILLSRGRKYIEKMDKSREQVVESCKFLIKDDMVILTHSRSRNVLATMIKAAQQGKHFKVYVTEAQPLCEGKRMFSDLRKYNIPCTLILDSAISYIIEKIDAVLLGAEGIGTCNVATIANLKNKPVYVLVESFKFIRLIPLNNSSIPKEYLK
ncbi:Translation initiation factor eIF-2B subunit alpha [Armadillidium vulgare]|nr:Translation initiation factor eIF-2B subunit alpha [Armadillidium vulgare]